LPTGAPIQRTVAVRIEHEFALRRMRELCAVHPRRLRAESLQAAARTRSRRDRRAATKLTHAPDANSCSIPTAPSRWIGAPVGKLLPGEECAAARCA